MGNNNIETIDMRNIKKSDAEDIKGAGRGNKREGGLDLSFFDEIEKVFHTYVDISQESREMVEDAAKDAISCAGLEHIKFSVYNAEGFKNSVLNGSNRLRGVSLSGDDEKYTYILTILSIYEDEAEMNDIFNLEMDGGPAVDFDDFGVEELDEDDDELEYPDNVQISLIRFETKTGTTVDNKDCAQYDFEISKWIPINVEQVTGFTRKQEAILNGDNEELYNILSLYLNEFGTLTDKQWSNLVAGNREVIDLYRRTSRFMSVELPDPDTIVLIPSTMYEGLSVSYEDGAFRLNSVFLDEIIATVATTKSIDRMEHMLLSIVDKQFYEDTLIVTPLSGKAFCVLRENGDTVVFYLEERNPQDLKEEEKKMLEKYLKKVNEEEF